MAGTFAHVTAVSYLYGSRAKLKRLSRVHRAAIAQNGNFCELGSVSPDYPYLKITSKSGAFWANAMHYEKTGDFARTAIPLVTDVRNERDRKKCIAWLFGHVSHLVADMTIHPVINLKVGPYEQNKTEHRRCEMNQDVYILNKVLKQNVTKAEILDNGIASCVVGNKKLFPPLAALWRGIFNELGMSLNGNPPKPGSWHRSFVLMHDKFAEEGDVFPFSRHFTDKVALTYPDISDIDVTYLKELRTPGDDEASYDDLFDRIVNNILEAWCELDAALGDRDSDLFSLPNGDLDSGLASGKSVYWENSDDVC